jgi:hypothetical protein
MPPKSQRILRANSDDYAAHRCENCSHLRYNDQRIGDPCRFCTCTTHVTPADRAAEGGAS